MTQISVKEILYVAELAKIDLSEPQAEKLQSSFNEIFQHFDELAAVDTQDVPPMRSGVEGATFIREDVIVQDATREEVLSNAPDSVQGTFFSVPKVIE